MPLEPHLGIMLLSSALSVTYPLCGSALTATTDNPSEMCQLKLTDFCLFLYHRSYTILQRPLIPPMAFTSCYDRGSNRLPPDGRANTNHTATPTCFLFGLDRDPPGNSAICQEQRGEAILYLGAAPDTANFAFVTEEMRDPAMAPRE